MHKISGRVRERLKRQTTSRRRANTFALYAAIVARAKFTQLTPESEPTTRAGLFTKVDSRLRWRALATGLLTPCEDIPKTENEASRVVTGLRPQVDLSDRCRLRPATTITTG